MHSVKVLRTVIDSAEKHGDKMLAVFDLDSTLYNVAPRITEIIREFANEARMRRMFPDECSLLQQATHRPSDWGVEDSSHRAGIIEPSEEFRKALSDYWFERFHSNDYLKHDVALEGAAKFVRELHDLGSEIVYLTGRDVHRYLEGTLETLTKDGFPISATAEAVLKPHQSWKDAPFKSDYFTEIKPGFQALWYFENEPVNLNKVNNDHPEVELVFFDGTHSGKEEPRDHYHRITHFKHK